MGTSKRWLSLATGTIMMVLLGLIYAWSIFVAPLEATFGWSRADTSLTFTICICFFVVGLLANGFLSRKLSPQVTLLLVSALLLAGFVLCSRVTTVLGLYLSYGVLVGFAVGVANNVLVSTLLKWFPDKTGTASGILMMGFGVGGMALGSLAAGLMESIGWSRTFFLFGIVFAAVFALGSFVVKAPPPDWAPKLGAVSGKAAKPQEHPDRSGGEVLRRPSFWLFICWFTLLAAGGLIVIGHASPFVVQLGAVGGTAAALTGIFSLCNGLGRILTGFVYDKLGLRKSMLLTTLYLLAASALLVLASYTGALPLAALGFVLAGLSYGGAPTTSSTFASGFYGRKYFSINYALASTGLISGAILGPYLAGVLYTSSGDYKTSFLTMLAFAAGCLVFSRFIRKP